MKTLLWAVLFSVCGFQSLAAQKAERSDWSDWTWVASGAGFHIYGYQVDKNSGPWQETHWLQVGTDEWNQHLIRVKPLCDRGAVQILQGWLIGTDGSKEVWSDVSQGRFSEKDSVQEDIVSALVSLSCGGQYKYYLSEDSRFLERARDRETEEVEIIDGAPLAPKTNARGQRTIKAPLGATALCKDGTWSDIPDWQKACEGHIGIASWVKR